MDLDQYLEKMNTNTKIIWIQIRLGPYFLQIILILASFLQFRGPNLLQSLFFRLFCPIFLLSPLILPCSTLFLPVFSFCSYFFSFFPAFGRLLPSADRRKRRLFLRCKYFFSSPAFGRVHLGAPTASPRAPKCSLCVSFVFLFVRRLGALGPLTYALGAPWGP